MRTIPCSLFTAACLFITSYGFGQTQIFIKATDNSNTPIDGGSVVKGYTGAIEMLAYSEGDAACGFNPTPTRDGACKTVTGALNFTMNINKSVIPLKKMMYSGQSLKRVDISFIKSGTNTVFYVIHMEDVFINALSESKADDNPTFFVGFDPTRIKWTYYSQKPDGSVGDPETFGWDRENQLPF